MQCIGIGVIYGTIAQQTKQNHDDIKELKKAQEKLADMNTDIQVLKDRSEREAQ